MSKVYFVDTGLRNMVLKNFSSLESRVDTGALIENTVCGNILKNLKLLEEMHFWRTLSRNEVDIVITKGGEVSPIEVKYPPFKSPRVPAGIRSFASNYPCERSVVLTRDYFGRSDKTIFLPVWLC
jgi:predicted AAA+ superfamily ATPase